MRGRSWIRGLRNLVGEEEFGRWKKIWMRIKNKDEEEFEELDKDNLENLRQKK